MTTVKEHYNNLLSDIYSWMYGGFETGIKRNTDFFIKYNITPNGSGLAIDLGAGCGFQSIPLARSGFSVLAIDLDAKLLDELKTNAFDLPVTLIQDDLLDFSGHTTEKAELIVCMTDTLLHLESKESVTTLFNKVHAALENSGKFIITFRDLTAELSDVDRFIPVRSDENTIFTCFLEYEPETVNVHDIVYKKENGDWKLTKSFYKKLRLSKEWVKEQLTQAGFSRINTDMDNGFITVTATR